MDFNVTDFNVRLRTIRIRDLLVACIIGFIIAVIIAAIFPIGKDDNVVVLPFAIFIVLFFIWALRGTTGLSENFSKIREEDNRKEIIYIFLINLLFAFIIVAIFSNLDIFYGSLYPDYVPIMGMTPNSYDPYTFFVEVLSSIIFAPIIEELIFRGILFNRLKIRIGIIAAMIISSAIFAIAHEFVGIISAFLFGMCMCVIYLKTDNILMSMSIHFLNNLVAVFLETSNLDLYLFQMPMAPITLLVSVISGVLIILYIYRNVKKLTA